MTVAVAGDDADVDGGQDRVHQHVAALGVLARLRQRRVGLLQRAARGHLDRQVGPHAGDADAAAGRVEQRCLGRAVGAPAPGAVLDLHQALLALPAPQHLQVVGPVHPGLGLREQVEVGPAPALLGGQPDGRGELGVDLLVAEPVVLDEDQGGRAVEQGLHLRLLQLQGGRCRALLRQVLDLADPRRGGAVLAASHLDQQPHRHRAPVGTHVARLQEVRSGAVPRAAAGQPGEVGRRRRPVLGVRELVGVVSDQLVLPATEQAAQGRVDGEPRPVRRGQRETGGCVVERVEQERRSGGPGRRSVRRPSARRVHSCS